MPGISPKLPIRKSLRDGFALTQTYSEALKQNFKNLVLTSPGERIMDPNFGVGIRRYLFENYSDEVQLLIEERVISQTLLYMPYVSINRISFRDSGQRNEHKLSVAISYSIEEEGIEDVLLIA